MTDDKQPKFAADAMLGSLAQYLLLAGFNTFYESGVRDETIRQRARKENRILLTRDS
ncbi:MAG: Mut7-C RNAse domain-containing protein, partial [bacterium]